MFGLYTVTDNVRHALNTTINNSVTSIIVTDAASPYNNIPDPTGDTASNGYGVATLVDSLINTTKIEIVTYTGVTVGSGIRTLTGVARGQLGSTAQSFTAGACYLIQSPNVTMMKHPRMTYTASTDKFTILGNGQVSGTLLISGVATFSSTPVFPTNSLARAALVNGAACSIIGRSANSSGAVADISMGTNDRILGRVSNVVGSTQLTAGMVPNSLLTNAMHANMAAGTISGNLSGSATAPSDNTVVAVMIVMGLAATGTVQSIAGVSAGAIVHYDQASGSVENADTSGLIPNAFVLTGTSFGNSVTVFFYGEFQAIHDGLASLNVGDSVYSSATGGKVGASGVKNSVGVGRVTKASSGGAVRVRFGSV